MSIRSKHLEILTRDPRCLRGIWSARNLSAMSVRSWLTRLRPNAENYGLEILHHFYNETLVGIEKLLYRFQYKSNEATVANEISDSHKMLSLSLNTYSRCDYWNLFILVFRIWYLSYTISQIGILRIRVDLHQIAY